MGGKMTAQTVRLVVSCTDRKRLAAPPDLQLRSYPGDLEDRAAAWKRRLRNPTGDRVPAIDLYQGEHWSVVRDIDRTALPSGTRLDLWIASAGYGLVRSSEMVESYGATFASGALDSIARAADASDSSEAARWWWEHLADRVSNAPTTLKDLAASSPSSPIVVALSGSYVRAVRDDLLAASAQLADHSQLLLVSAGSSERELAGMRVPVDARFQHELGGSRLSLNTRVAKLIVEEAPALNWNGTAIRRLLAGRLERQEDVVRYDRKPLSDDEVRAFIERQLAADRSASRTTLLRRLRDQNLACEQKRFGRLYTSVLQGAAT
jgi:hypothetical protein